MVKGGRKAVRHAGGLEMEQRGTVSLGPKGRNQQAQGTWPEDRSGGRSQRNQTERTQAAGWRNMKGNQERGKTRQGRGNIRGENK